MSAECDGVMRAMYSVIDEGFLDCSRVDQLKAASRHLSEVYLLLVRLERVQPGNEISSQLRPLFLEARDGFSEICCRLEEQDRRSYTGMTLDVLKIFKLGNVSNRLKASSKASRPRSLMVSEVLKLIKPEVIAERIIASKPLTSSRRITVEMVEFVNALLDNTARVLIRQFPDDSVCLNNLDLLQLILILAAERCIDRESMKDLFTYAEDVAYLSVHQRILWWDDKDKVSVSTLIERLSPWGHELRQIYLNVMIGLKSSRSETTMTAEDIIHFLDVLRLDLEELLRRDASLKVAFDDRILWLQGGLRILSGFLRGKQFNKLTSFPSHVEALAVEAAIVIYSFYDEEMDKTTGIDHMLFLLQLKFNHFNVEIDMIKPQNSEGTIIAPLKDLTDYVWGELTILGTLLMDALEQCKEQPKITEFLTLIKSETSQAWLVMKSLSDDLNQEELAREIYRLNFQLLLKFNFMKAVIRQMCPNISASSMHCPTINLLNLLPVNFEVIDSYLSMLKSAETSSSDIPTIDEVLMGFHEYILDNLLLEDESYLTFTVANEVKKFFFGMLLVQTCLVDPLVQCIGWRKHDNLLIESAICLIYEDAANSNKSRKVNLVLQFLTIAFKLIESEERLTDLLKHKATLTAQTVDLIESDLVELTSLRASLVRVLRQQTELKELHDLFMHAEVSVYKVAQLSDSCYESFMVGSNTEKMSLLLSDLLQEIGYLKVEFRKVCFQLLGASACNMIDGEGLINFLLSAEDWLLDYDACSISFLKNQFPVVKDKLVYLGSFLADIVQCRDMHQDLKNLVRRVQDRKYACVFAVRDCRTAWYYMLYLSDVRQLLKFVEVEVKMICLKVPDSSGYVFPKTNGLGFLNYFLGKLEELLSSKLDSIINLKPQIGSIREGLLCLRSLADDFADSYNEDDVVYSSITSVIKMTYKAEYVIDSCLTCSHPLWYKVLWISEVVENIKLVNKGVSETCERKTIDVTVHKVKKTYTDLGQSLSANIARSNEETEGFLEAMDKIKKQLLGGSPQLDVISLVGMPGIGKTTLAEKVYNNLTVASHFDVRAQCRVTQVYSWRDLLLTILNGILEPVDRNEKDDGELADELRRFMLTKRFLVLIDDVWDNKVWDNFNMCFKGAQNGSRIILTTRLSNVASYAQCESEPHHLRLFSDDESWSLLQKEVFQGDSCPPELVDVGFRIAKGCRGLPLFIVLVAGVLKEKMMKVEFWKEIEESLGSQNSGSLEESMSTIEFSYKNLPHQLKPCFLYFGGLLQGKNVHVSKLTRLWVAEGFVQGPEDTAHRFLEDLISRNLVMVVERRPNGRLKMCRIHDLLHKFCLEKAKQENFLLLVNGFGGEDTFPEKPKEYRLFVHSYEDQIDLWQPSCSNVRSLLFNVINPNNVLWPLDISFIFDSFKLIKVLDLESINIGGSFPCEIETLVHMRYFAAQTGAISVPSSIAKLCNLETFVVKGLTGEVILPSSVLRMVKLRHIHVNHRASFSLHENMAESLGDSQLDNLETFSTPHLSYGEGAEMILRKMPKLRKLSCIFSETFGSSKIVKGRCVLFPSLEFLSHLESLKLVSTSYPAKLPHVFSFPSRLRELTVSKFRLPWSQISTIGELPNLEILKLRLRTFEGDEWKVKDSEFRELKYLKLDDLNIARWSVSEEALPKLEHLVLTKCKRLEKIPSHFDDAVSLRSIDVNWCSWSVANSAEDIQTTQHEDMANYAFRVTIQPSDWARRSSA